MILTDREIRIAIEAGALDISPPPKPSQYSSTALDLTLDAPARLYKAASGSLEKIIDPGRPGYNVREAIGELTQKFEIDPNGFALPPQRLLLGWTQEVLHLKAEARFAARVEGKSSLARIGLMVHLTAPTIHNGFKGPIQLEIINIGQQPIRLRVGMPICQLIFEQTLGTPEKGYAGRFLGQSAATT